MKIIELVGRIFFALIFILSAPGLFGAGAIAAATASGVPFASFAVPAAGLVALVGGLCVATGFQTRFGAWLLVLFLVPVTWKMHAFWKFGGPEAYLQQLMFMKNLTLVGGALLVAYFGGGPWSIDAHRTRTTSRN